MNIDTELLYINLRKQLEYNKKLPEIPELVEEWLVKPWIIHRTLIRRDKSPYFHPMYEGVPMRLTFYEMCFFAFFSGVEYSFLKNTERFCDIDYWEMHKAIRDKFIIQGKMLYKGAKTRDNMALMLGGASDMGKGGVLTYMIIANFINFYFKEVYNLNDEDIFDEYGFEQSISVSNLSEVLHTFHDVATLCSKYVLDMNEEEFKKNSLFGGPGMTNIFMLF